MLASLTVVCAAAQVEADRRVAPPAVTLTQIEEAVVIYRTHRGPYWGVGKVFAEMGEIMASHHTRGPMFARYLDDPLTTPGAALRMEIGFFVEDDVPAEPPQEKRTIPAHEAATLLIDTSYGTTHVHHATVVHWIESNGYRPAGEVMEIYHPKDGDRKQIEIRVPILRAMEPAAKPEPTVRYVAELAADGAYEAVALELVPDGGDLSSDRRKWLLDVTDRLRVVREIVKKKFPKEAGRVDALVTPTVARGEGLRQASPPIGAGDGKGSDAGVEENGQERAAILRDLDRVMVRAHLKALSPEKVFEELVGILTRVQAVIRGTGETPARGETGDTHNP